MIYSTPIELQEKEIAHYCFEDCGNIIFAPIFDETLGGLTVCHVENCIHKDRDDNEPIGSVGDELVYLRKLKDLPE